MSKNNGGFEICSKVKPDTKTRSKPRSKPKSTAKPTAKANQKPVKRPTVAAAPLTEAREYRCSLIVEKCNDIAIVFKLEGLGLKVGVADALARLICQRLRDEVFKIEKINREIFE